MMRSLLRWIQTHHLLTLSSAIVFVLLGGSGGIAVGLTLEERNDFCASCHTQPEVAHVQRLNARYQSTKDLNDLATFHILPLPDNQQPQRAALKCISCHGGATPADRLETLFTLGVIDGLKFVSGKYHQPAKTQRPLPDSYCAQCHAAEVTRKGFENHFHNKLSAPEAPILACVSCHRAHPEADSLTKFVLLAKAAYPQCEACHQIMGGPKKIR